MKITSRHIGLGMVIMTALAGCNLPIGAAATPDANAVATKGRATLLALTPSLPLSPQATATLEASPITASPTQPLETPTRSKTPVGSPGTIEGSIFGYPYGTLPGLTIVAFEQEAPYNYSYYHSSAGETYFSMTSSYMIPGTYLVVAYDSSGHRGGCTTIVTVKSDQTVTCNISDWSGSYPAKPAGVP